MSSKSRNRLPQADELRMCVHHTHMVCVCDPDPVLVTFPAESHRWAQSLAWLKASSRAPLLHQEAMHQATAKGESLCCHHLL